MRSQAKTAAVVVRPIHWSDEGALQDFVRNLSLASRHARFMMAIGELPADMLEKFVHPQPGREAALVASVPAAGIVGLAQYVADDTGDGCEFAVVVGDTWQRQGLGTRMLTGLLAAARNDDLRHVHADVFADNHAMLALARKLGCDVRTNAQTPFLKEISRILAAPRKRSVAGREWLAASDW